MTRCIKHKETQNGCESCKNIKRENISSVYKNIKKKTSLDLLFKLNSEILK